MEFEPDDLKLTPFDAAEYILTDEDLRYFLEASLEDTSLAHMANALDTVIRAKGMMKLCEETGLSRQQLRAIINPEGGENTADNLLKLYLALGVDPAKKSDAAE